MNISRLLFVVFFCQIVSLHAQLPVLYINKETREVIVWRTDSVMQRRFYYSDIQVINSTKDELLPEDFKYPFVQRANIIKRSQDTLWILYFGKIENIVVGENLLKLNQLYYYKTDTAQLKTLFLLDKRLADAIGKNNIEECNHLLVMGASPNVVLPKYYVYDSKTYGVYEYNVPAICVAVKKGNIELTKTMLQKGASINKKDSNGSGVVHYAAKSGSLDMVKLVIQQGADPHQKNNNGKTPLDYAKYYDYKDIIEYLESIKK